MPRYHIDPDKTYNLPEDIRVINYNGSTIVIAPKFANWIVLDSTAQLDAYKFFRQGHSIKEALSNSLLDNNDVRYVVTQIEARRFHCKEIHSSTDEGRSMHLYLTNKCNLSCPHCYMFSGQEIKNELTTEEILSLINDYRNVANGTSITLSGGEPTSRKDFDLIVKTAWSIGLEVKVLTNGTLITPERVEELAKYIYSVQISIDGYSEESNAIIRGNGSFKKALGTVDLFLKYGVDTAIAITPPLNILKEHIEDYIDFARDLSKKYQDKPLQIKFAENLIHGRLIDPSNSSNKEYYELMQKIQLQLYGPDYEVVSFVNTLRNNTIIDNCMFGIFSIASNGDVYYCARIGDLMPVANVRTTSFKEIYEKSILAEKATLITNLKPCKECELLYICGGGCRIEEFPKLVKRSSFDNLDIDSIPPRLCNDKIKTKFYNLMIRSNKFFYSPLD
jgi:radical SAM protein with 4Fe4S-binding SPASM domain